MDQILLSITIDRNKYPIYPEDLDLLSEDLPWLLPKGARAYSWVAPEEDKVIAKSGFGASGVENLQVILTVVNLTLAITTAVTLGIHKVLYKIFQVDANREITIETKDKKLTLKGHSLPESQELLEQLFPEAINYEGEPAPSYLDMTIQSGIPVELKSEG